MRRAVGIALLLALAALGCGRGEPPRVILVSWDGAAQWLAERLLAAGRLPHLARLVEEGAWCADGMTTSLPTKTAAAHAALWTGTYGHANGITGNWLLPLPAAEHTRLERVSGFLAHGLRLEPLWVWTARAGLPTATLHVTQAYPFERHLERLDAAGRGRLAMVAGYSGAEAPAEVLSAADSPPGPPSGWSRREARGAEAREIAFRVGGEGFFGLFYDDPADGASGVDTLGVVRSKGAAEFLARLKAGDGGAFSAPIPTTLEGRPAAFALRLFALSADGSGYLLFRSGARAVAAHPPQLAAGELGVFAGNGGGQLYERGGFGPPLAAGGDGTAEARLVATLDHLAGQIERQAAALLSRGEPRLAILYSPVLDDAAHAFVGYLDPELSAHDPALAARYWPHLARAFELQDRSLGRLLEHADRTGADVVLVADHGMAGTDHTLNVNVALRRAGLLATAPDGSIDLARTRALLLPLSDGAVAVNSTDRPGGIVPPHERAAVLARVQEALLGLRHPETGAPLVPRLFEPATRGAVQPGGPATGDLWVDPAPGLDLSDRTDTDDLLSPTQPQGNHIFDPTRPAMRAICGARGPRIAAGARWRGARAIDVAPTVLDLLGLPVPEALPGRSLVAPGPALAVEG